jgi:hypothetical protein
MMAELLVVGVFGFCVADVCGQTAKAADGRWKLDSPDKLEFVNAKPEVTRYHGRKALRLLPLPEHAAMNGEVLAVLTGTDFKDGTIEVDVAGKPAEGATPSARGFIGIAFRVQSHKEKYECFYIRPTNGRVDDQLRRNHSTQYISYPDYPWEKLRKESPGVYESYADMESGAWTKLKIVVTGTKAQLYVNGAEQPTLIVNDLKLGDTHGAIALWSTMETDAYYSELIVK